MDNNQKDLILKVDIEGKVYKIIRVLFSISHTPNNTEIQISLDKGVCTMVMDKLPKDQNYKFSQMIEALLEFEQQSPLDPNSLLAFDSLLSDFKKSFGLRLETASSLEYIKRQSPTSSILTGASEKNKTSITFKDVIGMKDVKEKLYDVIDQFENRDKYLAWNIKPISGVLLYGPSGTGKSYISEALANEVDAKFIKVSAGDIMSKYIGESGKNIKRIFEEARKEQRSIIYMDEIDFVASTRGGDENSRERNSTLNELLVQMASPNNDNIFMIFATNMKELLDPAFLRSGRCDFKIEVPLPDFEARKGILESTAKSRPIDTSVDFEKMSRHLSGMNCADVTHVSNEAARKALKNKQNTITSKNYEDAFEELICGASNGTKVVDEEEKAIVAVHETGHLLANEILGLDKTKKISILPRGSVLGFVLHANEDKVDKFLYSEYELRNRVKVLLAGRAAEDIIFGNASTGASNDLEKTTKLVSDMVCKYGFDEETGLVVLNPNDVMLRNKITRKIKEILEAEYEEIKHLLRLHHDLLIRFSKYLEVKEELDGEEIDQFFKDNEELVLWKSSVRAV